MVRSRRSMRVGSIDWARTDESADRIVPAPSRRSVIKGGLLAIAGALGWGASAATSGGSTAPAPAAASGVTALELEGARVMLGSSRGSTEAGAPAAHGELLDPSGAALGSFATTMLAVPAGAHGDESAGAEMQVFNLRDGSIFGIGSPPPRGEGAAAYAVIGGTGRYAGASGSYTAELRPLDTGGDGGARFSFSLSDGA